MKKTLITIDVDWAPDFAIDFLAEQLIAREVKSTWFVTHSSPAIDRLRERSELFELGIHPNFMSGSTHGSSVLEVLAHCLKIVPEARCVRTHGLFQSSAIFHQIAMHTRIECDLSLYMPYGQNLHPIFYYFGGKKLTRIPYVWEDDFEMEMPKPRWEVDPILNLDGDLKVINFHPIHVFLNSSSAAAYESLKRRGKKLTQITLDEAKPYVQSGLGTKDYFFGLLERNKTLNPIMVKNLIETLGT